MNVERTDAAVADIAAAIGEPARASMLYALLDGRARTSTELAVVAGVSPSTASVHLQRLKSLRLIKVMAQGKHRYYSLEGGEVAVALEALSVLAGGTRAPFVPSTPGRLRSARTCYDHIAGTLGVALHDRFLALRWLSPPDGVRPLSDTRQGSAPVAYDVTRAGAAAFATLGIDVEALHAQRRRFAFACLDWSERRPHLGGALGAAVLAVALGRKWIVQELDSRALAITAAGRREMARRFGLVSSAA